MLWKYYYTVNLVPFLLLWTIFYMLSRLGVHPSCLYNQSRVNPATTNHLVSLPRGNHASDGRRHSTSTAWESCCWPGAWHDSLMDVHGEGITDAKPLPRHVQECNKDLLLHPPAAQLGNFPDASLTSKANLLYKEDRFLTDIHPEILLYFVTSLANIRQSSYVHVVFVIILLSRLWRRFETHSFKNVLHSPASICTNPICTNHNNSFTCNLLSISIIDNFDPPNSFSWKWNHWDLPTSFNKIQKTIL